MAEHEYEMISVVVPVYNTSIFLPECIESILNQSYPDIEIILVDDGSTDGSGVICDDYSSRYDRVKTYHKKNEGLGYSRNFGISKTTGKYIVFVDSDDYLAKNMIEKLYHELNINESDYCKGGFVRINDDRVELAKVKYDKQLFQDARIMSELAPRLFGSLPSKKDGIEMCVCGCIYKTDIIKKHSIRFPSERVVLSEDIFFNIEYLSYCKRACLSRETGYYYRTNNSSLTRSYRKDRFDRSKVLKERLQELVRVYSLPLSTFLRISRYFFVVVRACLSQERKSISGLTKKKACTNIRAICNDLLLRETIEKYPVKNLGKKQQLFLRLIKDRRVELLYLLVNMGVI